MAETPFEMLENGVKWTLRAMNVNFRSMLTKRGKSDIFVNRRNNFVTNRADVYGYKGDNNEF